MNIRNMERTVCTLITIATITLAGCGGGGSGGGGPVTGMPDNSQPPASMNETEFANLTPTAAMNARIAAAKVADAQPAFGSITQSSNTINNITQDRVAVTTTYGASQNTYSVRNGSTWSISTADGNPQKIPHVPGGKGSELHKEVNGGILWVDVYSDIDAPQTSAGGGTTQTVTANDRLSHSGNVAFRDFIARGGRGSLNGVSGTFSCLSECSWDIDGEFDPNTNTSRATFKAASGITFTPDSSGGTQTDADTDYLSGGVWLFVPTDEESADEFVFGAFVDGSDRFMQNALPVLTGTARYIGEATGIYSETENDATQIGYFDANATLDADFGDANGLGTIRGRLTGFEVDGEEIPGSLTLESAEIGASDSGFFDGSLSGSGYTGRWGGAFFGNGEADGKPGSVAGTFGGRSANSSESFVGSFGAYKE